MQSILGSKQLTRFILVPVLPLSVYGLNVFSKDIRDMALTKNGCL
jgi:hypothetical protein